MVCAGVEGTGSYGAALARYLKAAGIAVVEVESEITSLRWTLCSYATAASCIVVASWSTGLS